LSPRTLAYHLYNSYPKLGIVGRHQLRDLIDQATDPPVAPLDGRLRAGSEPGGLLYRCSNTSGY
jgi:hypothetical protein